ncbi:MULTISPECIES: OmpA family protein [Streptomyces]|uniref:Outer membrane protein OmpA n=1 Tax=Streptomyces pini TaxID=1520580 RepID=A0A1I3VL63_9ACTN|nr:OmpA family protein [Streptomyces pini]SFJ95056.1 Outer membrane protein OmpA [Streptomyces pini]
MNASRPPFWTEVRRNGTVFALSALLASGATVAGTSPAAADDIAPALSVFEGEVDINDPDLKLPDGATLAEPKVLEIKQVVGDEAGEEKREDSESNTKFTLQAEVLFGRDSAKLSPEANGRIKGIAEEIEEQGATEVNVFGYTDNLGSYEHGKVLSKKRAEAVHKQLLKDLGSGITFNIRGYSEDNPVADNSTEEGRKKNRRVEIAFPRGD